MLEKENLIFALIVVIVLLVFQRMQKTKMYVDKTGNKVVQHSPAFKVFSVFVTVGGTVLIIILLITTGTPVNFEDWLTYLFIFLLMGGLGAILILEVFLSKVYINDMGLSKKSIWTEDHSIQWKDIEKVTYSRFSDLYTITSRSGKKIRVTGQMDGVQAFIKELKSKCPEAFNEKKFWKKY